VIGFARDQHAASWHRLDAATALVGADARGDRGAVAMYAIAEQSSGARVGEQ